MFKFKKIRTKLVVLFSIIIFILITLQSLLSLYELSLMHGTLINAEQRNFDTTIETAVEDMISVLTVNYQRYLDGEITEAQAKSLSEKLVRDTRYGEGGSGYFWADRADGTCAVHFNAEYEGTMRYDAQDLSGNYYIQNVIAAGNVSGGGFTEFYFSKPGQEGAFKKRAYTRVFEPFGWYISTGNYYDDIEATIAQYNAARTAALIRVVAGGLMMYLLGFFWINFVAGRISRNLTTVTNRLIPLSQGDLHTPVPEVNTGDEFEALAVATKQTVESLSAIISDIHSTMQAFANGNFVVDSNTTYAGDLVGISHAIKQCAGSLSQLLSQINAASQEVAQGSSQVADGAQALAQGAAEQAASISDLTEFVRSMTLNIQKTAQDAEQAKQIACAAQAASSQGQQQLNHMVEAMDKISHVSGEIGKIIKNIDDIAFQTNILALNAAVEAARAGEAGKGFAVVAEEVRNLAGKSAESAKSTAELIAHSLEAVRAGSKIVEETVKSLNNIISSSEKSAAVIQHIADASIEQETAIAQVSNNLAQVSDVIQLNSATAEESAAVSEEMSSHAQMLKDLVGQLKYESVSNAINI